MDLKEIVDVAVLRGSSSLLCQPGEGIPTKDGNGGVRSVSYRNEWIVRNFPLIPGENNDIFVHDTSRVQ